MIGTLNDCEVSARVLAQSRSAVAANIIKSANVPTLIAHDDETLPRYLLTKVIPCPGELALVSTQAHCRAKIFACSSAKTSGETK